MNKTPRDHEIIPLAFLRGERSILVEAFIGGDNEAICVVKVFIEGMKAFCIVEVSHSMITHSKLIKG